MFEKNFTTYIRENIKIIMSDDYINEIKIMENFIK